MSPKEKTSSPAFFQSTGAWLNRGITPYLFTTIYLAIGTLLVYASPRNLIAFLIFMSSSLLLYYLRMTPAFKVGMGLLFLLVLVPIIGVRNISYFEVIKQICMYGSLALGLNIVTGFTGLLNLGFVAFFAVGAYLWAIFGSQQMFLLHSIPGTAPVGTPFLLSPDAFYIFLFLGLIVTALTGLLLGSPVLRLRGDYLAIVTLGFGEVIRQLANNLDKPINLTNGPQGITPVQRPTLPEPLVNVLQYLLNPFHLQHQVREDELYNLFFYLLALLIIAVIVVVTWNLDHSKIGRSWTAIREDELAAASMGVPLVRMKLLAFAVGASFAGIMGVLFAADRVFVSPESFNFMQSIGVLSMVILGGLGSIPGVILGAAVVTILNLQVLQGLSLYLSQLRQSDSVIPIINFAWKNLSNQLDPAKYQRMLFGMILILMMIYRPTGLIPAERIKHEMGKNNNGNNGQNGETPTNEEADHGAA